MGPDVPPGPSLDGPGAVREPRSGSARVDMLAWLAVCRAGFRPVFAVRGVGGL